MVTSILIIRSKDEKYCILKVDKKLSKIGDIIDFPLKLPMIVKPKPHNILVGYLLNDVYYRQDLIINKNIINDKSVIKDDNVFYNMINEINSIPYNTDLLDYILTNKHDLWMDPYKPSKYENIENRSKYQQSKYSCHN